MATKPRAKPSHWSLVRRSRKKKTDTKVVSISPPPFTMGKKMALGTSPERYRFIMLLRAIPIPAAINRAIRIGKEGFFLRNTILPVPFFIAFSLIIAILAAEKTKEKANAIIKNAVSSSLCSED